MRQRPLPSIARSRQRYSDARQRGKNDLREDPHFRQLANKLMTAEQRLNRIRHGETETIAVRKQRLTEAQTELATYRRKRYRGPRDGVRHVIREAFRRARP